METYRSHRRSFIKHIVAGVGFFAVGGAALLYAGKDEGIRAPGNVRPAVDKPAVKGEMPAPQPAKKDPKKTPAPVNALTEEQKTEAEKLVGKLADKDFKVREDASTKLLAMGAAVVPVLKTHEKHKDPEVQNRIAKLLKQIHEKPAADTGKLEKKAPRPHGPMVNGLMKAPAPAK